MTQRMVTYLVASCLAGAWAAGASAQEPCLTGDEDVTVAYLRQDCTNAPGRCFTEYGTPFTQGVNQWLVDCRVPTDEKPLVVEVGPGTFVGQFWCTQGLDSVPGGFYSSTPYEGHITFRGSGREQTVLTDIGAPIFSPTPVWAANCVDLSFQDLTLHGGRYGVAWTDGGSSSWTNVDLTTEPSTASFGWLEAEVAQGILCTNPGEGVHYFFNSRVRARYGNHPAGGKGAGYHAACGETWFYAGEIVMEGDETAGTGNWSVAAVNVANVGRFFAFGTSIRMEVGSDTEGVLNAFAGGGPIGVLVGTNLYAGSPHPEVGQFHMHGGIVVADGSTKASEDATALVVDKATMTAHTPATAMRVHAGPGGQGRRAQGVGKVLSPLLWEQGEEPPRSIPGDSGSPFVTSVHGADVFVETDCSVAGGGCGTPGDEPHLMIYSENCPAGNPWFNVVMGACRQ